MVMQSNHKNGQKLYTLLPQTENEFQNIFKKEKWVKVAFFIWFLWTYSLSNDRHRKACHYEVRT